MSVILQPYQALPFNTSLDFQVSRQKGGSLCDFENIIDEGNFIPFAILSPDSEIGEINVYDCSDVFLQSLILTIVSEQDVETGLWFHYYAGADLGLSCGTYYISILVGDFIWYSEQFTIRDVINSSQYPELIKDNYHLPLRIYDSITKQLVYKYDIGCDVQPLNPLSQIMPFMFDTDEDINDLDVFLVDVCSLEETDLSADIDLEFIKSNSGTIEYQEVLTTSQQLRNEYYQFDSENYVFQEFRIEDTGVLNNIIFGYDYKGRYQTLRIELIRGTNPSDTPLSVKTISDTAVEPKDITINYLADNINVAAGDILMLKIITDDPCEGYISVNSVKVYPNGRFAERNTVVLFKEMTQVTISGTYEIGDVKYAVYTKEIGDSCNGTIVLPANPSTYSYKYTANKTQIVKITASGFEFSVKATMNNPVEVTITIATNTAVLYSFYMQYNLNNNVYIAPFDLFVNLENLDYVTIIYKVQANGDSVIADQNILSTKFFLNVYNYGEVIDGVYYPTNFIPTGILYQNKSLWFYCNVTKAVYINGRGTTQIYNPGRPLPSPLICGNYYLKLVSNAHTWYSEWFRVINVGLIDLTVFVLGTESGEIISTEDQINLIEP